MPNANITNNKTTGKDLLCGLSQLSAEGAKQKTTRYAGARQKLYKSMLYENVIAQMLTANGHKLYFYTHYNDEKHRNDMEVDFILSNNSKLKYKIYPIEVKSGAKYTTTSLLRFREKFKERIFLSIKA